eukprot:Selendium_serpulae@DN6027_c0_g1_i4.p2
MWCIAFDIASDQCVATGADDCCLKLWDTRAGFAAPTAQNKKHHTMGVTSLAFSPIEQNVLYSGSYDEYLRVWDKRDLSKPITDIKTAGGIWRIRFDSTNPKGNLMLACCYGGSQVYHHSTGSPPNLLQLEASFEAQSETTLSYGITRCGSSRESEIYASCSFYEQLVSFW